MGGSLRKKGSLGKRQQNKLPTKKARLKRVRLHCCHAARSETDAHFGKLPSLSFCAAFPRSDPLERQLPVEQQQPKCVVFHKFHLKGWNEANKSVFFSFREADLCTLRASHFCTGSFSFSLTKLPFYLWQWIRLAERGPSFSATLFLIFMPLQIYSAQSA